MDAREKVNRHVLRHIGHRLSPGGAVFDEERRRWRVPVSVTTDQGLFSVGEFELDESLDFITIPPKADMLDSLRRQVRETHAPRTAGAVAGR